MSSNRKLLAKERLNWTLFIYLCTYSHKTSEYTMLGVSDPSDRKLLAKERLNGTLFIYLCQLSTIPFKTSEYTILGVSDPSDNNTFILSLDVQRERATYNCP
jgi:hypothetical protein